MLLSEDDVTAVAAADRAGQLGLPFSCGRTCGPRRSPLPYGTPADSWSPAGRIPIQAILAALEADDDEGDE
jgi:hypothetical protein